MTVVVAVAVLVGVLALATALGLLLRSRTGRARPVAAAVASTAPNANKNANEDADQPTDRPTADLAPAESFGTRATLVQFSTPTCARCPATRRQLDSVASRHEGVERLEIDLAERPDLARRFAVMQTPTVLLLDHHGVVRTRFGGPPRPPELAAALDTVLSAHQESR